MAPIYPVDGCLLPWKVYVTSCLRRLSPVRLLLHCTGNDLFSKPIAGVATAYDCAKLCDGNSKCKAFQVGYLYCTHGLSAPTIVFQRVAVLPVTAMAASKSRLPCPA